MAVIDPRTYRPTTSKGSSGVTTHVSALQGSQPDVPDMYSQSKLRAAASAPAAAAAPNQSGWKGLVADVLGNSVVKTVLKPLQVLDYGRRTVLSTVKELVVDPLSGQDTSWDDFTHQVDDETFGAGKILASVGGTGNKWVDRIIGGIGDVAADPLTYLSLGTSSMLHGAEGLNAAGDVVRAVTEVGQHAGGQAGRVNLAKHFAAVTGDTERALVIAREGRAALTADEVARLGLQKSGYYMFGKKLKAVRIPGSGAAAKMSENGLSKMRLGLSETSLGKGFQRAFTTKDFRDVRLAIAQGKVPEGMGAKYMAIIDSRQVERQAAARAATDSTVELKAALDKAGPAAVESFRKNAHIVMEGGLADSPAHAEFSAALTEVLNKWAGDVNFAMQAGGDGLAGFDMRTNYFPHMPTEDALKQMAKAGEGTPLGKMRGVFNPLDPVGVFNPRHLQENSMFFGYKLKVEDLNLKRLNEIATEHGKFVGDFFETDAVNVLSKYTNQYSHQMGSAARLAHLETNDVFGLIVGKGVTTFETDASVIAGHRVAYAEKVATRNAAGTHVLESSQQLVDHINTHYATAAAAVAKDVKAVGGVSAANASAAAAGVVDAETKAALRAQADVALANVTTTQNLLKEHQVSLAELHGRTPPPEVVAMQEQLTKLHADQERLREIINAPFDEASVASTKPLSAVDAVWAPKVDPAAEAATIQKDLLDGLADQELAHNNHEVFAAATKSAVEGEPLWEGASRRLIATGSEKARKSAASDAGFVEKLMRVRKTATEETAKQPWWDRVFRGKDRIVSMEKVRAVKESDIGTAIATGLGADTGEVLRTHSAAMLVRDHALHRGEIPQSLDAAHQNLLGQLELVQKSVVTKEAVEAAQVTPEQLVEHMHTLVDDSTRELKDAQDAFDAGLNDISLTEKQLDKLQTTKEKLERKLKNQTQVRDGVVAATSGDGGAMATAKAQEALRKAGESYAKLGGAVSGGSGNQFRSLQLLFQNEVESAAKTVEMMKAASARLEASAPHGMEPAVWLEQPASESLKTELGRAIAGDHATEQFVANRGVATTADQNAALDELSALGGESQQRSEVVMSDQYGDAAPGEDIGHGGNDGGGLNSVWSRLGAEGEGNAGINVRTLGTADHTLSAEDQALKDAWDQTMALPTETNGDVKRMIDEATANLESRTWTNSKQKFTVADGVKDSDGRSNAARAVDESIRLDAKKTSVGVSREATTKELASRVSEYYAVSETAHRWLLVSQKFASYGQHPPRTLFNEVAKTVSDEIIHTWKSQVAKAVEAGDTEAVAAAQKMVDHLTAFRTPSDELYNSMQHDVVARLRTHDMEMGAALPEDQARLTVLNAKIKKLRSSKDDVSPYNTALQEEETNRFLLDHASYDMWKAQTSGVNGFRDASGVPIMMPDGKTPLTFSENEWNSLYVPSKQKWVDAAGKKYGVDELPDMIDAVAAKQAAANDVLAQVETAVAELKKKAGTEFLTGPALERYNFIKGKAGPWAAQEAEAAAELKVLRAQLATVAPETLNVAKQKATLLVQKGGVLDEAGLAFWVNPDPAVGAARKAAKEATWPTTAEAKLLGQDRALTAESADILERAKAAKGKGTKMADDLAATIKTPEQIAAETAAKLEASKAADMGMAVEEYKVYQADKIAADQVEMSAAKESTVSAVAATPEVQAKVQPSAVEKALAAHNARVGSATVQAVKLDERVRILAKQMEIKSKQAIAPEVKSLTSKINALNDARSLTAIPKQQAAWVKAEAAFDAASGITTSVAGVKHLDAQLASDLAHWEQFMPGAPAAVKELTPAAAKKAAEKAAEASTKATAENAAYTAAKTRVDNIVAVAKNTKQPVDAAQKAELVELNKVVRKFEKAAAKEADASAAAAKVATNDLFVMHGWVAATRARLGSAQRLDSVMEQLLIQHDTAFQAYVKTLPDMFAQERLLKAAEKGTAVTKQNFDEVQKGFTSLKELGFAGSEAENHIANILLNMKRTESPVIMRELNRFIGPYTQFFKAYATLSPGFHVRNALSNTFALFGAGAETGSMHEGLGLFRQYHEAIKSGTTATKWLEGLAPEVRAHAEVALGSMEAAGGGRSMEAFGSYMEQSNTLHDNWALRKSRKMGSNVEDSARFMLGFDSAKKGLDMESAAIRTKRYLFDYTDVGVADETIKQIVPFWMWMSRNLPMTIVNQWTNPRAYATYANITRNMSIPDGPDSLTPSYLSEQGGIKVAEDWWITPDTGFNRLQSTIGQVGNFSKMASMVNPVFRLPIELMGDKKMYNGAPLGKKMEAPTGGLLSPAVGMLASLLGQSETNAAGEQVVSDKFNYGLTNAIPFLNQSERLIPNTDAQDQKKVANWMSYLGVPVKKVTTDMRQGEQKRRNFDAARQKAMVKLIANAKG